MARAYGQSETKYNEQESGLTNHLFFCGLRSNRSSGPSKPIHRLERIELFERLEQLFTRFPPYMLFICPSSLISIERCVTSASSAVNPRTNRPIRSRRTKFERLAPRQFPLPICSQNEVKEAGKLKEPELHGAVGCMAAHLIDKSGRCLWKIPSETESYK